jgi:uncharacterized membrane protein HdeD (DUF308 family)
MTNEQKRREVIGLATFLVILALYFVGATMSWWLAGSLWLAYGIVNASIYLRSSRRQDDPVWRKAAIAILHLPLGVLNSGYYVTKPLFERLNWL